MQGGICASGPRMARVWQAYGTCPDTARGPSTRRQPARTHNRAFTDHESAMPPKKPTDFAFHQLGQVLRDLETDLRWKLDGSVRIPAAWHEIAQERQQPARAKVTLRVDEDVLRFFRAMGQGHLTRMNAVLRAFMLARLAEVVKAEPPYEMTPKETEGRIRSELIAVMEGQERAQKAAEDRLAEAAKYMPRLKVLKPVWEGKVGR